MKSGPVEYIQLYIEVAATVKLRDVLQLKLPLETLFETENAQSARTERTDLSVDCIGQCE